MSEEVWLSSDSPNALLNLIRPWTRYSRRLQLYVCAWYRNFWHRLNEPSRILIECCELAAANFADEGQIRAAKKAVRSRARQEPNEYGEDGPAHVGLSLLSQLSLKHLPGWEGMPPPIISFQGTEAQSNFFEPIRQKYTRVQLDLLREIVGNPFKQTGFDPSRCDSQVTDLSRCIYLDRRFDQLPILAEELHRVGCENIEVLSHLRVRDGHVRGCWALDLAMGWA